jgi:hypothetical protein
MQPPKCLQVQELQSLQGQLPQMELHNQTFQYYEQGHMGTHT